jgi:hypothetical protein
MSAFQTYWDREAIRLLGDTHENHIPTIYDRTRHAYEAGAAKEREMTAIETTERIVALIAHEMDTARTFHGKESEVYLRYRNLIEEIRHIQGEEM